ncbi:hypothetical protein BaRGS_00007232 [Batillaria attramentaria]|uniref:Secreted protein n=1 Tax=Batillaria attramentaria TaxID=370345 RepID=A0ABD0LPL6_9CAEN
MHRSLRSFYLVVRQVLQSMFGGSSGMVHVAVIPKTFRIVTCTLLLKWCAKDVREGRAREGACAAASVSGPDDVVEEMRVFLFDQLAT